MNKINTIDLFCGCGGLLEGFLQSGHYNALGSVDWELAPCENLRVHLKRKWGHQNADNEVIRFDIQRTPELLNGFSDKEYGEHKGCQWEKGGTYNRRSTMSGVFYCRKNP